MASKNSLKNSKLLLALIVIVAIVVIIGVLTLFTKFYQTEDYYQLAVPVQTRTQVTPQMLEKVTTQKGTAPKTALTPSEVQTGQYYTRFPLQAGDILTPSNTTGGLDDISVGIPDSWVITNFGVPADNAVGGRVGRGVYFDMMVTTDQGSFYPFVNMLALDTSVSLSGASSASAVDTAEAKSGQTQIYYVGATPQDAARLQSIMKKYAGSIRLVLSPRQNEYQAPDLKAYEGLFTYSDSDKLIDSGKGTDSTFSQVERDEMGRPKDRNGNDVKYLDKCGNNVDSASGGKDCTTINNNTYNSASGATSGAGTEIPSTQDTNPSPAQ